MLDVPATPPSGDSSEYRFLYLQYNKFIYFVKKLSTDYNTVLYQIVKKKFKKILFPNKQFASSLYKKITRVYFDYLINIKHLIELK